MQRYYEREKGSMSPSDRFDNLVYGVFIKKNSSPKLRCSAAKCRRLVQFVYEQTQKLPDKHRYPKQAAINSAIKWGSFHLNECYKMLSSASASSCEALEQHSTQFAVQYVALDKALSGWAWTVKPKIHMFLELCREGSKPSSNWCYRDEDYGGTASQYSRRRGGLCRAQALSSSFLRRWRAHPFPKLISR